MTEKLRRKIAEREASRHAPLDREINLPHEPLYGELNLPWEQAFEINLPPVESVWLIDWFPLSLSFKMIVSLFIHLCTDVRKLWTRDSAHVQQRELMLASDTPQCKANQGNHFSFVVKCKSQNFTMVGCFFAQWKLNFTLFIKASIEHHWCPIVERLGVVLGMKRYQWQKDYIHTNQQTDKPTLPLLKISNLGNSHLILQKNNGFFSNKTSRSIDLECCGWFYS